MSECIEKQLFGRNEKPGAFLQMPGLWWDVLDSNQ